MRGLVFSIDDAYVLPLKVLWRSLHTTESVPANTPIFILHESALSEESIADLADFIGKSGFDCSFIDTSHLLPTDLPISESDHVSRATFYRLYIANLLPESVSSVVYLDPDAVVMRSVAELFELELEYPIAAVDALTPLDALRVWGDCGGSYFSAGVLLIDVCKWRDENFEMLFNDILANERARIQWWDQCVLNIAFEDNWQRLPVWFNVSRDVRKQVRAEIVDAKCKFLHFDGGYKPWLFKEKKGETWRQHRHWYQAHSQAFGLNETKSLLKSLSRKRLHLRWRRFISKYFLR